MIDLTQPDQEFDNHPLFERLNLYSEFYDSLGFHVMNWVSMGTAALINLDTYVFSSMQGTIESLHDILKKKRFNDAYALLRKYLDVTMINVYVNLYLEDRADKGEVFLVKQIEGWRAGTEKIPENKILTPYIRKSAKLKPITDLILKDKKYKDIRQRCNDHTHYNFYHNVLMNNSEIFYRNRIKALDAFMIDLDSIFIQHFSYLFYLKENYMTASDIFDCMDLGIQPEEDSQYFVAPFIQNVFDEVVKKNRVDLADELKSKTSMMLQ